MLFVGVLAGAPLQAQAPAPLENLIREAMEADHLLAAERYAERAAEAEARVALGRMLPSLGLASRVSEQRGGLDLGDFVNPSHEALNELLGARRFPTDLDLTLPQRHDTHLRLVQPVFAPALWASRRAAAHRADARSHERRAAARRLAADVQVAYYEAASAERAAAIHRAALDLTREAERVGERLLAAGRATPDVVLRARAERSEAEQSVIEADDAARAALRALNRLAGRPLDAPLDSVDAALLLVPVPVSREEAVAHALAPREEIAALDASADAAEAARRAAASSFLPDVAVALDYGAQGNEVAFDRTRDYLVGTVTLSWNLFRGGADAARVDAARARADALRAREADARSRIRLEVLRAHDAAEAARAAIAVAEARLASAARAYELVARRFGEGLASTIELVDARRARTAAELNRSVSIYRYAIRLVDLERAAALRAIE